MGCLLRESAWIPQIQLYKKFSSLVFLWDSFPIHKDITNAHDVITASFCVTIHFFPCKCLLWRYYFIQLKTSKIHHHNQSTIFIFVHTCIRVTLKCHTLDSFNFVQNHFEGNIFPLLTFKSIYSGYYFVFPSHRLHMKTIFYKLDKELFFFVLKKLLMQVTSVHSSWIHNRK